MSLERKLIIYVFLFENMFLMVTMINCTVFGWSKHNAPLRIWLATNVRRFPMMFVEKNMVNLLYKVVLPQL